MVENKVHNVTLSNVAVNNIANNGILFSGKDCVNNKVVGCKVTNIIGGAGIAFYNTAGTASVENNFVYRTRHHCIIVSRGGSNYIIKNNTVYQSGYYIVPGSDDFAHGIALDGGGVVRGGNHLVASNTVINSGLAGIEVADFQDNVVIELNFIDGTGTYKEQDDYGIYFGGGLTPSVNCIIRDNIIKNTNGYGIRTDAPLNYNGRTENVQIVNNYIENAGTDGIRIGKVLNSVIVGNVIMNVSSKKNGHSGILANYANDTMIKDNTIDDDRNEVRTEYNIYIINCNNVVQENNRLDRREKSELKKMR